MPIRFDSIREALVLILMMIFSVAIFYSPISLSYKAMIAILALSLIFLVRLLTEQMKSK